MPRLQNPLQKLEAHTWIEARGFRGALGLGASGSREGRQGVGASAMYLQGCRGFGHDIPYSLDIGSAQDANVQDASAQDASVQDASVQDATF